jgi:hypothetical protein
MGIAAMVCSSEIQRISNNCFSTVAWQKHHCILHHPMADYWEHCYSDLPNTGTFKIRLLVCTNFSDYHWINVHVRKNKIQVQQNLMFFSWR